MPGYEYVPEYARCPSSTPRGTPAHDEDAAGFGVRPGGSVTPGAHQTPTVTDRPSAASAASRWMCCNCVSTESSCMCLAAQPATSPCPGSGQCSGPGTGARQSTLPCLPCQMPRAAHSMRRHAGMACRIPGAPGRGMRRCRRATTTARCCVELLRCLRCHPAAALAAMPGRTQVV